MTNTVAPAAPVAGAMEVRTGGGGVIVNASALLGPEALGTCSALAPSVAAGAIVKVAAISVGDTLTLLIVIPAIGVIVAPARFAPVISIGMTVPRAAVAGATLVKIGSAGAGGKPVSKVRLLLVPAEVSTLNEQRRLGDSESENSAAIWILLTMFRFDTVTPAQNIRIVAPG